MRVQLYSKRNCPLCEVAHETLERLRARYRFDLGVRYIEDSPVDFEQYRYDVPVVFLDGERAFQHRFSPEDMEKRLLASGMRVASTGDGNGSPAATRGESRRRGGIAL